MKRMMWKPVFIALFISALFSSCLLGLYQDPEKIGDWCGDVEEGTKYTVRESYVDINGDLLAGGENPKTTVRTVISVESEDGVTEVYLVNDRDEEIFWVIDENNNQILYSDVGGIYLAAPIEVGTSWDVQSDDWDNPDVSEIITVGGVEEFAIGELDDLIVIATSDDIDGSSMNRNSYFSPSIGMEIYSVSRFHLEGSDPSNDEFIIREVVSID